MGEVWRARDTRLKRDVAIKILPDAFAQDPERVRRFQREGELLASLNHPNIAAVYGFDEANDSRFLVLELVEGETLAERLKRGLIPTHEALELAEQICTALDAAHERHVIHRDLKPANMKIASDGKLKLLDFGLAKMFAPDPANADFSNMPTNIPTMISCADGGVIMGTAPYMSPEQIRGGEIDERSDIFSLGVVLYEMLAGRRPFNGDSNADVLAAVLTQDPPIGQFSERMPAALQRIVRKALAKSKPDRYATVSEVLSDLRKFSSKHPAAAVSSTASASIVVLPFSNVSADAENEYFCDGLADDLINALTRIDGLFVVARTSAFSFRGTDVDIREIGRKLNVAAVLAGSVQKAGDRLRITAQLINVSDGYQLWSEQFDRVMEDVFAIQDEMSLAIVAALRVAWFQDIAGTPLQHYRGSTEAYHLYLKGIFHQKKMTPDSLMKSIDYFQQAVGKDPNYALAYAQAATSYAALGIYYAPPVEVMPKAKVAALKALALDERTVEAHGVLGLVKLLYEWDWMEAERELKLSGKISRHAVETLGCVCHLMEGLGRGNDAISEIETALVSDPLSIPLNAEMACTCYYARHFDEAIQRSREVIEMVPDFMPAYWAMARALGQKGMYANAIELLNEARRISGGGPPFILSELGYLHGLAGRRNEAESLLRELEERSAQIYVDPCFMAVVHLGMNDQEKALDYLDRACAIRSGFISALKSDPKWDAVLEHPRMTGLLRRAGLGEFPAEKSLI